MNEKSRFGHFLPKTALAVGYFSPKLTTYR
jgi:hypothetical protein